MAATADLFTPIHKALRSMIYQLSSRLQTHDFADVDATRNLLTDLENDFAVARTAGCVLCVLSQHAVDEESTIFPDVSGVNAELVRSLIEEHHGLTTRELAIAQYGHGILSLDRADARITAGARLNRDANELFGAYVTHMNREEAEVVPLMREHFTNEQMAAMQGAIIGRLPPERMAAILGYMLPSLHVTELRGLLGEFGRRAPPPVKKVVSEIGQARVDPARWQAVKQLVEP